MSKPKSPQRAFTLVELLVVVGIIALLISILMPALTRARSMSRQLKCLGNVRQIGLADSLYVAEYRNWHLPAYWGWSPAGGGWDPGTAPAIPPSGPRMYWFQVQTLTTIFKSDNPDQGRFPRGACCPEAILSERNANKYGLTLHESYGANYTQYPGVSAVNAPEYWNAWTTGQVVNSAEKVFYTDATSEGVSVGYSAAPTTPNSTIRYFAKNFNGEDWSGEKHEPPHYGGAVAYRHNRGANVLYFDGHAQRVSYDDFKYDPATDGSTSPKLLAWQPKTR